MSNSIFDLNGKVAIVTGCNTGLGAGMAVALAEAGADIVGVNRSSLEDAKSTQDKVERLGKTFKNITADLSSIDPIEDILLEASQHFGKIDILVNNAGIIRREDAIDFSEKDWDDVLGINLKTVFFFSKLFAKKCVNEQNRGKIINIASMLSFQGGIRVPSYTASKSAVMGLTRALANEWARHNINVNAIAPGYMATNNTQALREDSERNKAIVERIPAGRWGKPEDIGGACVFLASQASDYVNGHTLAVDGGWLAR